MNFAIDYKLQSTSLKDTLHTTTKTKERLLNPYTVGNTNAMLMRLSIFYTLANYTSS